MNLRKLARSIFRWALVDFILVLILVMIVISNGCQFRRTAADYEVRIATVQAEANNWELDYKFLANQITVLGNKQIELNRKVDEADAARDALMLKQQFNDQGVSR